MCFVLCIGALACMVRDLFLCTAQPLFCFPGSGKVKHGTSFYRKHYSLASVACARQVYCNVLGTVKVIAWSRQCRCFSQAAGKSWNERLLHCLEFMSSESCGGRIAHANSSFAGVSARKGHGSGSSGFSQFLCRNSTCLGQAYCRTKRTATL